MVRCGDGLVKDVHSLFCALSTWLDKRILELPATGSACTHRFSAATRGSCVYRLPPTPRAFPF